ncbi:hypothetical protein MSG37_02705 [Shewanella sp. 1CM18E]|uniref:hypothetical protein n=1 Tax=Shewanella sp. 1CM18E TaxID=2929169 RepID=UPI0020BD6645|nr:hypothetical protein [Shewanella sp. 1CM18E]MCK8043782.1 hypothetical protein [Shewanella sp. 1CM18E]
MDFIRHAPALFSLLLGIAIVECSVVVLGLSLNRLQGVLSKAFPSLMAENQ